MSNKNFEGNQPLFYLAMFAFFVMLVPMFGLLNSNPTTERAQAKEVVTPTPEPTIRPTTLNYKW